MATLATRPLTLAWWGGRGGEGAFLRHHRITAVRVGRPLQDQQLVQNWGLKRGSDLPKGTYGARRARTGSQVSSSTPKCFPEGQRTGN